MKKVLKQLFFLSLVVNLFASCKKDENKLFYLGGNAPTLSASVTGPLVLTIVNRNNPAITFNWTNPDYQFTTGISSQDVNYTLEIDSTGSNFTNPTKGEIIYSKVLSTNLSVGELNSKLLAAGFVEEALTAGDYQHTVLPIALVSAPPLQQADGSLVVVWVVGNQRCVIDTQTTVWDILGVFDTESVAVAACTKTSHFIGPLILNARLPDEVVDWVGSYYPLAGG